MRFRLFLTTLGTVLASFVHAAESKECLTGSAEDRLACLTRTHCPVVTSEAERSQCYRRIVLTLLNAEPASDQPLAASVSTVAPSTPAATASVMPDSSDLLSAKVDPVDEFGYEKQEVQKRQEAVDEISSRIVFLDTLARGNYLIGLENGQLWQQIAKSRTRLKQGETVRIVRGSLGSFRLIPERSTSTNVNRVICHGDQVSSLCAAFEPPDVPAESVSPGAG